MNLTTNKQFRNIQAARKHRRQATRKAAKEARRQLAEQIAKACNCPECRAKRGEIPGPRIGNA